MLRTFMSLVLALMLIAVSVQAQSDISRFQKQHNSKFNKKNLKATQEMLIQALESGNSHMITGAAQTVRELLQIFPTENFDLMLIPLTKIVKNEKGETASRILSLFALESLHSDAADISIKEVQNSTSNITLREICNALSVEDINTAEVSSNKDKEN
jgi:hypothetical protein